MPTDHERPAGVPADAYWSEEDGEWISAPLDNRRRKHGLVRYWRQDGTLCCETAHKAGVPHGSFKRYHESGEISRDGQFVDGKLQGRNTFYRSEHPTTETFPAGLSEEVWRAEMDFRDNAVINGRAFDRQGRRCLEDGTPFPERPATVPEDAHYLADDKLWIVGAKDENNERTGAYRWWSPEGVLVRAQTYRDGKLHGSSCEYDEQGRMRLFSSYANDELQGVLSEYGEDGSLINQVAYRSGRRNGRCNRAVASGVYSDKKIVRNDGFYSDAEAEGVWKLLDRTGKPRREIDLGVAPGDSERLIGTALLADEVRQPAAWLVICGELKTANRFGEAIAAAARAAGAGGDLQELEELLTHHVLPLSEKARDELTEQAEELEDFGMVINAISCGSDPAAVLRRMAVLLDQHELSWAALDFVEAALMMAPERKEYLFTKALVLISLGQDSSAGDAIAELREASPDQATFLQTYLNVLFARFDFWPARAEPQTYYDGLPEKPAQPIEKIIGTMQKYATRLMAIREAMLARADSADWTLPDLSELLPEGPVELGQWSFEGEDPDDEDEMFDVEVDETIDVEGAAIPTLMRMARDDWNALCWLCWAVGLDEVVLPEELSGRDNFGKAAGMAAQRLWRCRDKVHMDGQGAEMQEIEGFVWEGVEIDELHPAVAAIAESQYAEMQAMFYWLTDANNQSPWQDNLRGS